MSLTNSISTFRHFLLVPFLILLAYGAGAMTYPDIPRIDEQLDELGYDLD